MSAPKSRPQNKNLKPLNKRPAEEARAIRSAGGKACAERRRERKRLSELLQTISDLPVKDGRTIKRLKAMGISDEDMCNKILVADALFRACKEGNTYAIAQYLELMGETSANSSKENNLLAAIQEATKEDIDIDDLPEIQQETALSDDLVEQTEV